MQRCVQLLVRPVVRAADHVRDLEVDVVDDAREVERRRAVVAPEHHSLEALRQPGLARRLEMPRGARALPDRPLVPVDAEPPQILEHASSPPGEVPGGIGVVDPQQQPVAEIAGWRRRSSALPTCSDPVGLGAKRTRFIPADRSATLDSGLVKAIDRIRSAARGLQQRPRLVKALQLALLVATLALCIWAVRSQWSDAWPLLQHARVGYVALAFATVSVYYLVFILGWMRILDAWGIRCPTASRCRRRWSRCSRSTSPAASGRRGAHARARRGANVTDTPTVLASILVEAALSAISGVIVFVISLAWVNGVDAPLWALIAFAVLLASLLHPRDLPPVEPQAAEAVRRARPRAAAVPDDARPAALLLRHVGDQRLRRLVHAAQPRRDPPSLAIVAFLGGVSAVGAIVAVLAFFAPSGLGAREASMYGLLLAVTSGGARTRGDGDEPVPDHGRRGGALRRRAPRLAARPRGGRGPST